MPTTYEIGEAVTLTASVTDGNGTPADATAVTLKLRKPDGNLENDTPSHDETGSYSYTFEPDQAGRWFYRFEASGSIVDARESSFYVRESAFA